MALLEDLGKANPMTAVALGAVAIALPMAVPALRPQMRSLLKTGLTLFFESETEVEGDLIDKLVGATMQEIMGAVSGGGSETERRNAAEASIETFKRKARSRAQRWGRNDKDRAARFHRHLRRLDSAISRARHAKPGAEAHLLERLGTDIIEDW